MTKPYVFTCSKSSADWDDTCSEAETLKKDGKPLVVYAASEREANKKACEILNAGENRQFQINENGELMRNCSHGYVDRFHANVPSLKERMQLGIKKPSKGMGR